MLAEHEDFYQVCPFRKRAQNIRVFVCVVEQAQGDVPSWGRSSDQKESKEVKRTETKKSDDTVEITIALLCADLKDEITRHKNNMQTLLARDKERDKQLASAIKSRSDSLEATTASLKKLLEQKKASEQVLAERTQEREELILSLDTPMKSSTSSTMSPGFGGFGLGGLGSLQPLKPF